MKYKELIKKLEDIEAVRMARDAKIDELSDMLEDVVNELDLSDAALDVHGPAGTPPAELLRIILEQKNKEIYMLKKGFVSISNNNDLNELASRDLSKKAFSIIGKMIEIMDIENMNDEVDELEARGVYDELSETFGFTEDGR